MISVLEPCCIIPWLGNLDDILAITPFKCAEVHTGVVGWGRHSIGFGDRCSDVGYSDIHTCVPRICIPSYLGYSYPHTPDIHTLVPPDIYTRVPRIFIPSYPGYSYPRTPWYSYPRTPDIHTILPRIFIPSYPLIFIPAYPGYSYHLTLDIHTLVPPDIHTILPRIFIPSYPGY